MYGSLDISTSGLIANRIRLEAISANIANADSLMNQAGKYEPFRRRMVTLAAGGEPQTAADGDLGTSSQTESPSGVHVASIDLDDGPPRMKYEPGSPFANADGYV